MNTAVTDTETDKQDTVLHNTDLNNTIADTEVNQREHTGNVRHTETNDTTPTSERTRRPPGRFHYPELGKPLISFAQSLLESFTRALDTIHDYDVSPIHVF